MSGIRITAFIGEQPRIIPMLLPPSAAQAAVNVRLDDGALTPIKAPIGEDVLGTDNQLTIYRFGASWLSWAAVVHAAPGPVASDRLYYTGDGAPKLRVGADVYDLALPFPAGALTATLGGVGAGDVVTRIYVYTWVTDFGEESEPNPASNAIDWKPGNTVTLSGFVAAPAGRNITKQRIYRSQTGQSGTYFYLINERAASNANFADTVAVDAFAEPLPSADWTAPPNALEGLIPLPNGMMAAFAGRDIYFCEPWRPHAWPQKYVLTTDVDIVGLGAIGTSVVVMTEGNPYLVGGSHPSSMQMQKMEQNLPCINRRGIVDMGYVIAYPSHEGLVAVGGDGSSRVVTANLFNRDAWLALTPATLVGGQIAGRYVAFYQHTDLSGVTTNGAIFIDLSDAPYLIRTAAQAAATYFEVSSGALFYLKPNSRDILRLDAPGGAPEQMYWRSKEFRLSAPENFGAILVDAAATLTGNEAVALQTQIDAIVAANAALIAAGSIGGELDAAPINTYALGGDSLGMLPMATGRLSVGVYADGTRVAQIEATNRPLRLPGGFLARSWEIDVTGDLQVTQIVVGKTIDDIKNVPA